MAFLRMLRILVGVMADMIRHPDGPAEDTSSSTEPRKAAEPYRVDASGVAYWPEQDTFAWG